jgi:hypothetical protein
MTRNLRTLALSLIVLVVVVLPASSVAKHRGHATQVSAQSVGSVASFAEGVLAIEVADGTKISGAIVPRTRMGCARSVRGRHSRGFRAMAVAADASRRGHDDHGVEPPTGPTGANGATGPDGAWEHGIGHGRRTCDVAALKVGTKVLAADMTLTESGPVWRLVIFLTPDAGPTGPTGPTAPQAA